MFQRLNFWLLARLPRRLVVLVYTLFVLLGVPAVVVGSVVVIFMVFGEYAFWVIIGTSVAAFCLWLIYNLIDDALPAIRKRKNEDAPTQYPWVERVHTAPGAWHIRDTPTTEYQSFFTYTQTRHTNVEQDTDDA